MWINFSALENTLKGGVLSSQKCISDIRISDIRKITNFKQCQRRISDIQNGGANYVKYSRQQEHIKQNYKKVTIIIKNETYLDIINNYGTDIKLNNYINQLISKDINDKSDYPF